MGYSVHPNSVRNYQKELANKNQTEQRSITLDATLPVITISYPLNQSYSTNVSDLNYTYSDDNSGSCWYSNNGGADNYSVQTAGTNFTDVISVEGANTWIVYCSDLSGNENSSNVTFFK